MMSRNNQQTWRLAKWLFDNCTEFWETDRMNTPHDFNKIHGDYKNDHYDLAKKLTYMFAYNAFTGPDNHDD